MAKTLSTMLPLGTPAPGFTLPDVITGQPYCLGDNTQALATVIMFICNHCPFVIHIQEQLAQVARQYQPQGIEFIAINANDIDAYPADAPIHMIETAAKAGYTFPYLFDASQEVAKAYDAACTPDFYVFDRELKCVYRGQFDDSRPGNGIPVTGKDLAAALECIIAGQPVPNTPQKPSMGCNIKFRA